MEEVNLEVGLGSWQTLWQRFSAGAMTQKG